MKRGEPVKDMAHRPCHNNLQPSGLRRGGAGQGGGGRILGLQQHSKANLWIRRSPQECRMNVGREWTRQSFTMGNNVPPNGKRARGWGRPSEIPLKRCPFADCGRGLRIDYLPDCQPTLLSLPKTGEVFFRPRSLPLRPDRPETARSISQDPSRPIGEITPPPSLASPPR